MIKATCRRDGRKVLVLALSHANLDRLRTDGLDGYIKIDGRELGLPTDVYITAGPTEADIAQAFITGIGPDTKLHIDKRLKS